MKNKKCTCNSNNAWGLALGLFLGGFHAFWAILVASGLAQPLIDWIFKLHMIRPLYVIAPFDIVMAVTLVIVTFIIGYIAGWVFAAIRNNLCSCCSCKK